MTLLWYHGHLHDWLKSVYTHLILYIAPSEKSREREKKKTCVDTRISFSYQFFKVFSIDILTNNVRLRYWAHQVHAGYPCWLPQGGMQTSANDPHPSDQKITFCPWHRESSSRTCSQCSKTPPPLRLLSLTLSTTWPQRTRKRLMLLLVSISSIEWDIVVKLRIFWPICARFGCSWFPLWTSHCSPSWSCLCSCP